MNKQNLLFAMLSTLLLLFVSLGCGGGSGAQTDEANKLINEANKIVDDAKDLVVKTEQRNTALFGVNLQTVGQLQIYKARMKDEAQDIAANFGKVADMANDASKKYAEASKMNLADKFKEYLDLKAQEFAKRGESASVRKGNAQAFVDYDDPTLMVKRFKENNEKSDKLTKEADDLAAKSDKIYNENRDIFKS